MNAMRACIICAALAFAAGCMGGSGPDEVGQVQIALDEVPEDVSCARITGQGARNVQRLFDVEQGQRSVFTMNSIPVGEVTFRADTFDAACSAVSASSVPTWVSRPVVAEIIAGIVTEILLKLRRNGRADVTLDFEDGGIADGGVDGGCVPQGPEVCAGDGVDEDCDGYVDETNGAGTDFGLRSTSYPDGDGDGYGDEMASTLACNMPDGHVTVGGDCDDDPSDGYNTFPLAPEICDGVDNDCDEAVDVADDDLRACRGDGLLISEYVEGSGRLNALELYNAGPVSRDLASCSVSIYFNGASDAATELVLSGVLQPGETRVVCQESGERCDAVLGGGLVFTGNDALTLQCDGARQDMVGVIGDDADWGHGMTLRRDCNVTRGVAADAYDADQWHELPEDHTEGLGSHCPQMLFTEYVEGSGFVKALEITNLGVTAPDVGSCQVALYSNGATTASARMQLQGGPLASGASWVICRDDVAGCDQVVFDLDHNGNDALALECGGETLDVLGQIGDDTSWGTDVTLRRACGIRRGDNDGTDPFDPSSSWDVLPQDTLGGLGSHCPRLIASEYLEGTSRFKALELTNMGTTALSSGTCQVEMYTNGNTTPNFTFPIDTDVAPGQSTVLCSRSDTPHCDQHTSDLEFNGNDTLIVRCGTEIVDVLGQLGNADQVWGSDATLRRACHVREGDTIPGDAFAINSDQWSDAGLDVFSGLGKHCPMLVISEYVEGSSTTKAIELANRGLMRPRLDGCTINIYYNGNTEPMDSTALEVTDLPAGTTHVMCRTEVPGCDQLAFDLDFNGNDAIELACDGETVDVLGQIGNDDAWGQDATLRRMCDVRRGDMNGEDPFARSEQWSAHATDDVTDLGMSCEL